MELKDPSAVREMAPTAGEVSGLAHSRWWDVASLVSFAVCSMLMLLTLRDYGFTYDEPPHIRYGDRILQFYSNGFNARASSSYVGGFDVVAALLRRISPFDMFVTNHVLCIFVAMCGLLGTWKLGRLLGGPLAGFASFVFLVLTPVYYSHQFNNPKDVPFAAGYVWGLYMIAKPLVAREQGIEHVVRLLGSWKYFLQLGLAIGLGMSVRVGGALLIGYLFVAVVVSALEYRRRSGNWSPVSVRRLMVKLAGALALSWGLLLVCWPKALVAPIEGPASAAEAITRYKAFDSPTLLRGKLVSSHDVPWDYLPTYFGVMLPELTLIVFVGALLWWARRTWLAVKGGNWWPLGQGLLMMAVLLPPSYAIVRGSVLYDGLRHFLFIIPPIAVMCGLAVTALLVHLERRQRRWVWVWTGVLGLFVVDQTHAMVATHPYQHVHFNRISGGTKRGIARYESEYYGALYQELGDAVAQAMWNADPEAYLNRSYKVTACGSYLFVNHNFPINFQYESLGKAKDADLFATYPRDRCLNRMTKYPLILRVERAGATLGVARDLKGVFKDGKKK
jgi:hypothetical protein